jgi:hypothetical protein
MDDSLTNVVPKDQVMLHKLGGAPECHAPELAQELRVAKAEVGACTRTLLTHALVHPLPCAWAVLVARELCESSGGIFQLQPLRHDATFNAWPRFLFTQSLVRFVAVVCCVQKRAARLCFAQQSSYELGTLAYRIITGSAVVQGAYLPSIPDLYPHKLHILLPRLVATDPGTAGCEQFGCSCSCPVV